MPVEAKLIPRHASKLVDDVLADTPIAVIQGARQVGKSTLAKEILARRGGLYRTLDDLGTRGAAKVDPVTFVNQLPSGCLVIDEIQRVPELILALKTSADSDRRPGRFLLTGSANLLRLPAIEDSLAGRAESVELFGLSQGELRGHQERFIDTAFSGKKVATLPSDLPDRASYLRLVCAGGYPEPLARTIPRRQRSWFDNYIARITQRDALDISNLHHIEHLPTLLRLIASHSASTVSQATLARESGIHPSTLPPYLALLETLYLVQRIPAWSNNLSKRIARSPKIALLDSGLAAWLVNVEAERLAVTIDPDPAGTLVETFVLSELRKQIPLSETEPRLYHYRELERAEVDVILEAPDGRIVALEIKASASLSDTDFRWLKRLRDKLSGRFVTGIVLYTGSQSLPWGDRLFGLPLAALWA